MRVLSAALFIALACMSGTAAHADDASTVASPTPTNPEAVPGRPVPLFNRWQEDWSVLANPAVPKEYLDNLKYIPLSADDPKTFLSLGMNLRERYELNDSVGFGTGPNRADDWLISRLEVHSDLRIASQVQVFIQLQSDYAVDKKVHTPVDQDRLDLEQAFVALTEPVDGGILKLRLGRQEIGFDLQRFISVRDGPNVRQAYDAAWADYEQGPWRYIAFFSHPVQDRDLRPFDDYSNSALTYGGFRIERKFLESATLAAVISRFTQDAAKYLTATGNEVRNIADLHFDGTHARIDWDVEGMAQSGEIGAKDIRAWAFGSILGYTWSEVRWAPRAAVQVDAASGNKDPNGQDLNTFNPLFPNGYYVTLAGYTGYVNFIHIKPSVTFHPSRAMKLMFAVGAQWRETTADAVYAQPDIPIAGTAGHPGRYTGTYGQLRVDDTLTDHWAVALEAVHFAISDAIRSVGGHDSNYVGAEVRFAW